jgi:hypothetical protein
VAGKRGKRVPGGERHGVNGGLPRRFEGRAMGSVFCCALWLVV